MRIEIFQGDALVSFFELPEPSASAAEKLEIADRKAPSVALRAISGASTIADSPYRIVISPHSVPSAPVRGVIYLGPGARHSFSWRTYTVSEEVLTSLDTEKYALSGIQTRIVANLLAMFHLSHTEETPVTRLSGGEAQRLALLLALISGPRRIIIDHALSEQDRRRTQLLEHLISRLLPALGIEVLYRAASASARAEHPIGVSQRPSGDLLQPTSLELRTTDRVLCKVEDIALGRGQVLLLTGENGTGKSLLCKALIGFLPREIKTRGKVKWADALQPKLAYAGQDVSLGFSHSTTKSELDAAAPGSAKCFLEFPGVRVEDLALSPFELTPDKQRFLAVLKATRSGAEIVVLDEPSEHWDEEQLAAGTEYIDQFVADGRAAVIASHDSRLLLRPYERVELRFPNVSQQDVSKTDTLLRHDVPAHETADHMQAAWARIHEAWPSATLDIFQNWSGHVDGLIVDLCQATLGKLQSIRLLDLGCGNGLQTIWVRSLIRKLGGNIELTTGYDWQPRALEWASFWSSFVDDVGFCKVDLEDLGKLPNPKHYNLLTSFFVLHDLPKMAEHVQSAYQFLPDGGAYLGCFLNPDWVTEHRNEVLSDLALSIEHDAEYMAAYVLPEDADREIFVPYFHRDYEIYRNIFTSAGFSVNFRLGPCLSPLGPRGANMPPQTVGFVAFKQP